MKHGIIAVRKAADKAVCICKLCCCNDFFVCCVQLSVADIFHNSSCEKVGILKNDSHRAAQIRFFNFIYIDAVIADFSVLNVVKTVQKICDRCFSCSCRADKGNFLSRCCVHFYIVENDFVRIIAKVNAVQYHIAFQFNVIGCIVCFMVMLPCPAACTFFRLFERSVFFFYIYKCYVAFVHFRFFVEKVKDSFRACKCHDNAVKLLAYLVDRHIEAFVESEEACKSAKSKAAEAVDGENAAENRA